MSSILSSLESVKQALAGQQFALSITQRNVANASNESYTRQDAVFADVTASGGAAVSIQANRDRYLDFSIGQETQSLGKQQATSSALQQIDAIFNENSGTGLQQALSDFFNAFSALSTNPEDTTLRQQVLSKSTALTAEFHRLYSGVQQVQSSVDNSVKGTVDEINSITSKIAALNQKIQDSAGSEDQFSFRDERQQLLENLSGLTDLSYYETESGSMTVMTQQGGLLVIGKDSFDMETSPIAGSGFQGVQLGGVDITSTLHSGKLAGLIAARDQVTGYLNSLDDMAAAIATRVNEQHSAGRDLDGVAGGNLFSFTTASSTSTTGAARSISIAFSDLRKIAAASSTGGLGNNENAKLLCSIRDEKLLVSSSETASEFYASLIYKIGSDEQDAAEGVTTQKSILGQLKNQRSALSGVDLNEEAVNMIKYQKAYQASARFANVLDILSNDILSLLGTS
jgi:flagellar hook-associated protein 1